VAKCGERARVRGQACAMRPSECECAMRTTECGD